MPNLSNWTEPVDVAAGLRERLDLPISLGNDANVGLLGEWRAGAARGSTTCSGCGWEPASEVA